MLFFLYHSNDSLRMLRVRQYLSKSCAPSSSTISGVTFSKGKELPSRTRIVSIEIPRDTASAKGLIPSSRYLPYLISIFSLCQFTDRFINGIFPGCDFFHICLKRNNSRIKPAIAILLPFCYLFKKVGMSIPDIPLYASSVEGAVSTGAL